MITMKPDSIVREVIIDCEIYGALEGSGEARVILCFGPAIHTYTFNCFVKVEIDNWKVSLPELTYYGHEVSYFIEQLQELYNSLKGSAVFTDWDLLNELIFKEAYNKKGYIEISGYYRFIESGAEFNENEQIFGKNWNFAIAFKSFRIDQTYLPGIIKDLKEALRETGVSLDEPRIED
jgi:hypothetical protein